MNLQKPSNQKGEIEFRKKLYNEQVKGANEFDGNLGYDAIEPILKERMDKTFADISQLIREEAISGPYLEIGAERGQRALSLENDLNLQGCAFDISFDMLNSCQHYSEVFSKPQLPIRVCGDVYNLPFRSNSVPFVLVYEMLHHFPDPVPVVKELYRVLAPGGLFYFDEEPYEQVLHADIYNTKKYDPKKTGWLNKLNYYLDFFFLDEQLIEHKFDVIENHDISLVAWKAAMKEFESLKLEIFSVKGMREDLLNPSNILKMLLCRLFGGVIRGRGRKPGSLAKSISNIEHRFICPDCLSKNSREITLDQSITDYRCPNCNTIYPIRENVLFLFSKDSMRELYPDMIQ